MNVIIMPPKGILDLPPEIFHHEIFQYIDDFDVYNFGNAGSKRLKQICEDYVQLGKNPLNIHDLLIVFIFHFLTNY